MSVACLCTFGQLKIHRASVVDLMTEDLLPDPLILISTVVTFAALWNDYDVRFISIRVPVGSLLTGFLIVFFRLLMPLGESSDYLDLRWKAWTGPSRSGIPPYLMRYLGNEQDWISMLSSCRDVQVHPVERFLNLVAPFAQGIEQDPTSILSARLALDEEADTLWMPRSEEKACVYAPSEPVEPISFLWGARLGFRLRCSRGIVSVLNFNSQ